MAASNQSAGVGRDLELAQGTVGRDGQPTACRNGDPGGSRTPNPQLRRLMLYPVELRGRLPLSLLHRRRPTTEELKAASNELQGNSIKSPGPSVPSVVDAFCRH